MKNVRFVESHWNRNAAAVIPEYWTPDIGDGRVYPCPTREDAEKLASELLANES